MTAMLGILALHSPAYSIRCGTGIRNTLYDAKAPVSFLNKKELKENRSVSRVSSGVQEYISPEGHFRILWGENYNPGDPEWNDPDGNGLPIWIESVADALEYAFGIYHDLGFPEPYGSDRYYLDVYIDDTGVEIPGEEIRQKALQFASTDIDSDHQTSYFIFSRDFSPMTQKDELEVLRATAAHELFHSVQRSYFPWDDPRQVPDDRWQKEQWWFEATSTWLEEVVHPSVDDYIPYVQDFLQHPELSLNSLNGYREYGASIFAGYLWTGHEQSKIWDMIFLTAFDDGLEKAIDNAIYALSGLTLNQEVASFWTLAAHPEDFWPDGKKYNSASGPVIYQTVYGLPSSFTPPLYDTPGRFGAHIYQINDYKDTLGIKLDSSYRWSIGISSNDSNQTSVTDTQSGAASFSYRNAWGDKTYIAVVNTSNNIWDADYTISLGEPVEPDKVEIGADSGGCFINTSAK